jgi:uncharacterized protein YraI
MFSAKIAASTMGLTGILAGGILVAGAGGASAATAQTMMVCKYKTTTHNGHLNVRSGPGLKFRIVGHLYRNEWTSGPCRTIQGWTLVDHYRHMWHHGHGRPGFVHSKFVKQVK